MLLKRVVIILAALVVLAICAAGGMAVYAWQALNSPLRIEGASVRIEVKSGSTLSRVGTELAQAGILEHPGLFTWYGRIGGTATDIKMGEFDIPAQTTPVQLLELLVSGNVVQYSFTIVEGWRFSEMLAALREHEAVTLTGLEDSIVMERLGKPDTHPEGQFLPDTYHFPRGTSDLDVLARAHDALNAALDQAWQTRSPDIAVATPYDALILASIIEKETGLTSERREIAGVYSRRLRRGMRLQADPTVIYGLGEAWDGDIRRADLLKDTPYNTYTRSGLPPTPIALAGRAAIEAAVDPMPGDSVYFVATGEGDGSHYFSATLQEHNAAVQRYLQRLRDRSSGQ
ncbi:MAG: endolytic transglycosylase MltG [Gammaproteobacteria bacterium]|jgi:UPF0755 protein